MNSIYSPEVEALINVDWVESETEDTSFEDVRNQISASLDPIDPYTLREMQDWSYLADKMVCSVTEYPGN